MKRINIRKHEESAVDTAIKHKKEQCWNKKDRQRTKDVVAYVQLQLNRSDREKVELILVILLGDINPIQREMVNSKWTKGCLPIVAGVGCGVPAKPLRFEPWGAREVFPPYRSMP